MSFIGWSFFTGGSLFLRTHPFPGFTTPLPGKHKSADPLPLSGSELNYPDRPLLNLSPPIFLSRQPFLYSLTGTTLLYLSPDEDPPPPPPPPLFEFEGACREDPSRVHFDFFLWRYRFSACRHLLVAYLEFFVRPLTNETEELI